MQDMEGRIERRTGGLGKRGGIKFEVSAAQARLEVLKQHTGTSSVRDA